MIYRFGEFEYDVAAYQLRRHGQRVHLARQPMDLLLLLLQRPRALVSHDEIARRLWSDSVFTDFEAGIRTAVLRVRQALGDSPLSPRYVETVAGKGYRFAVVPDVVAAERQGDTESIAEAAAPPRHNLPAELTRFVGRAQPLAELRMKLASSRLLSLTGPGGVGKTRLALRLARNMAHAFPDGIWFADFGPLTAPELLAQSMAVNMGVRESPGRSLQHALVEFVRERELLLIFDTCEHLLEGCAELAETLLRTAPALRILATTREPLAAPGETIYRVPPLSLPEPGLVADREVLESIEATALFLERAAAAHDSMPLNPENVDSIVRICRRLDGIPLAIELAAAQSAALSPEAIDARLDEGSLPGGRRTVVVRQRTLDATIDWSYQLLSDAERRVFNSLSVFPSSWTADAAASVYGDGPDKIKVRAIAASLASKSLARAAETNDGPRYELLETIRHFAAARLHDSGGTDAARDRHFACFDAMFPDSSSLLTGPDQAAWLRRLYVERDNVRAALNWGLSSSALAERAVDLTGGLFWYWTKRGLFAEGRQWLQRAARVAAPKTLQARVALGLGHMDYFQGRFDDMNARNDELLAWGRESHDPWLVSRALFGHALAAFEQGAFDRAASLAAEARGGSGEEDFSGPLLVLGNVALVEGDRARALHHFDEAIKGLRAVGEVWGLGIVLSLAAGLRGVAGELDAARAHAAEAISIYSDLEDPRGVAWSLDVFAALAAAEGRAEDAARLWGASDVLLERVGGALVPTIGWIRERHRGPVVAALGERAFSRATTRGRALTQDDAMMLATGHSGV